MGYLSSLRLVVMHVHVYCEISTFVELLLMNRKFFILIMMNRYSYDEDLCLYSETCLNRSMNKTEPCRNV